MVMTCHKRVKIIRFDVFGFGGSLTFLAAQVLGAHRFLVHCSVGFLHRLAPLKAVEAGTHFVAALGIRAYANITLDPLGVGD